MIVFLFFFNVYYGINILIKERILKTRFWKIKIGGKFFVTFSGRTLLAVANLFLYLKGASNASVLHNNGYVLTLKTLIPLPYSHLDFSGLLERLKITENLTVYYVISFNWLTDYNLKTATFFYILLVLSQPLVFSPKVPVLLLWHRPGYTNNPQTALWCM